MSNRVRTPGGWTLDSVVDPAEFEALDDGQANAIDGRGGTYAPTSPVLVGGRGIEDCNAEHHLYTEATGNITIGPTDSHRIRIFGGNHINGTIVVLINDDTAFARKSVYVSTLNAGSRVRIRNSANTIDYHSYTAVDTQTDLEIEVERTEESGSTAWRRTRASRRDNETALVNYNLSPPSSPYENEYALLRISGTIATEKEIILSADANGKERVVFVERTTAILRFSDTTAGSIFYTFDPSTDGGGDGVEFHFWRQSGNWRWAYLLHRQRSVVFSLRSALGSSSSQSFSGGVQRYIDRIGSVDPPGSKEVILNDGSFVGQEYWLHHAGPAIVEFKRADDTTIYVTPTPPEPAFTWPATTFQFYWDGDGWQFAGCLTTL